MENLNELECLFFINLQTLPMKQEIHCGQKKMKY